MTRSSTRPTARTAVCSELTRLMEQDSPRSEKLGHVENADYETKLY